MPKAYVTVGAKVTPETYDKVRAMALSEGFTSINKWLGLVIERALVAAQEGEDSE